MERARPAPLKRNHRQQLFRFQTHALTHLYTDCTSVTCDGIPKTAEWSHLLCPLCLEFFDLAHLDEDHAPQEGGQSRLGGRHLTVLVCRDCNQGAGKTFEKRAAFVRNALKPPARDYCDVHHQGRRWTRPSGLEVPVNYESFDLTDAKAAYLMAFATLGYSWVLSPRLDELRSAFVEDRRSGDWAIGDLDPRLPSFAVLEVVSPTPCVIVTSDRVRVYLPCGFSAPHLSAELVRVDRAVFDDSITGRVPYDARRFEWPRTTIGAGSHPEKTWDHSFFFALDRCGSVDHTHIAKTSDVDLQTYLNRARDYWIGEQ